MKGIVEEQRIEQVKPHATALIENDSIASAIQMSWSKIAPFWPLKHFIAVNPMVGFEDMPFETALKQANAYFQQTDLPKPMETINRETIKWLQIFFDEGQATDHTVLLRF